MAATASRVIHDELDPFYLATLYFRMNKIDESSAECTKILEKNPLDQAAWSLKLACFTEEVFVDELENDEAGLADAYMDDHAIVTGARPGTSLNRPVTDAAGPSPAVRPRTQSGRPLSGMLRPESRLKTGSMEQMLRTSRTSPHRSPDFVDQFLNLSRLNVDKYAADLTVNRQLFEYVFLHEGDMKAAHQIAATATKAADFEDWYWKNALGKTYYRLGMLRGIRTANSRPPSPLSAIDYYKAGLEIFPGDVTLLTGLARIHEQLGELTKSIDFYKQVMVFDAGNVEAIACMGNHFFYSDQPELAVKFYRRILQIGVTSPELYLNLGLCCFYCQQLDLALGCIEQAHAVANEEIHADLWFNTAHIAFANGDIPMAERCLRIALASNPDHAESLCNLGIIKMRERAFGSSEEHAHFNLALLNYQLGYFYDSFAGVTRALEQYPGHEASKTLLKLINPNAHHLLDERRMKTVG
ncbi:hypothetical protein M3Y99_01569800 [Aphelenchoides fujianensis]|nr:hypothetical protein M3Y99_01569800 [Aphelenchoides fujianensis]